MATMMAPPVRRVSQPDWLNSARRNRWVIWKGGVAQRLGPARSIWRVVRKRGSGLVSTASSAAPISEREHLLQNRWLILLFSVISMVAVANLQYGWTLFVPRCQQLGRISRSFRWRSRVFVLLETWLVPFEGCLVDRFGPRLLVPWSAACWPAWAGSPSGWPTRLTALYLAYAVAGLGAGIVYGTAIGQRAEVVPRPPRPGRRPDRRGVRRRLGAHRGADRQHDQVRRLPGRVHPVGHHPGRWSSLSRRCS